MTPVNLPVPTEIRPLAVLIGDPGGGAIIAVSTSGVFADQSLIPAYWDIENTAIDNGFQGHLYSAPEDTLVVRAPGGESDILHRATTAISVNQEIWSSLTGIRLASPASHIVFASEPTSHAPESLPRHFAWRRGSLLDAATTHYKETAGAFLAHTLNDRLIRMLDLDPRADRALFERAAATSLLMDKNAAMELLRHHSVDRAATRAFKADDFTDKESSVPSSFDRCVFKPAGGAAGIGVFSGKGEGATLDQIHQHIARLSHDGRLPDRFQIQEFVQGTPLGVSGYFDPDGGFTILEVHEQLINDQHEFVGARWTPGIQAAHMPDAHRIYKQLGGIDEVRTAGSTCIDMIDGRVIELNPRLTAAAPIVHLLQQQEAIARYVGHGFRIMQIDLHTDLDIPYALVQDGTLQELILRLWRERSMLVLPQGLNPFGTSKVAFINDRPDRSGQALFIRGLR